MAQLKQVRIVDDIDESPAVETLELAINGKRVELDLSQEHADELRDATAKFMLAGRPVGSYRPAHSAGKATPVAASKRRQNSPEELEGARAFARKHGLELPSRGKVEACVWMAYRTNTAAELERSKHWKK